MVNIPYLFLNRTWQVKPHRLYLYTSLFWYKYRVWQWIVLVCKCAYCGLVWVEENKNTAIMYEILKHFSCNGIVDWSTNCLCCKSILLKWWFSMWSLSVNFGKTRIDCLNLFNLSNCRLWPTHCKILNIYSISSCRQEINDSKGNEWV